MSMSPDKMLANMLQYGHNGIMLRTATIATDHLKIPPFTSVITVEHGNGHAGFMNLCQGTSLAASLAGLVLHLESLQKAPMSIAQ